MHLELSSELPKVLGDRIQLQQVIINLVMNGMEAMASITHGPRQLRIRSRREAQEVLVIVEVFCAAGHRFVGPEEMLEATKEASGWEEKVA